MRRRHDDKWECALCGEPLDVPTDGLPTVVIDRDPDDYECRVIMYRGGEVHRCELKSNDD